MDQCFETYKISKVKQDELDNLNKSGLFSKLEWWFKTSPKINLHADMFSWANSTKLIQDTKNFTKSIPNKISVKNTFPFILWGQYYPNKKKNS